MSRYLLLTTCSVICLALSPVVTHADDTLSPRAEVSVKGGTERSILTTEFWAPLVQQSGKVLYGDLRLMGDNDDNREGNLGFGYRQVSEPLGSVVGSHIWIDRRRTDNNNTFHQITIGAESLGNVIDLRANGYIALNGTKTAITPNLGSTTPYLAGSGVFIDTTGRITETAQHGADAEVGYRLLILQHYADTIRVFGGGYDFFGNGTDNLIGYRVRTEAQVNSAISVGARFQHDNQRGDQGFLEATLRFPFSAKKLYQQKGLYGRLDESPQRDVDIVTSSKVTSGLMTPLTNTSGTTQRILYVDNSTTNGDGTKEHPFNNLQSAQSALQANDILYVARGTGTTSGMDQGITITQNNVQLIGSGSALTIDGYTFINAGLAPTITNTTASTGDETIGNGINIYADNAHITGINITGASRNGIYALAQNGQIFNNLTIDNINEIHNFRGVYAQARDAGTAIKNISVDRVFISGDIATVATGVLVNAYTNSQIDSLNLTNIISMNGAAGISINLESGGHINAITGLNNTVTNNTLGGILVNTNASTIDSITIGNTIADGNKSDGVRISSGANSVIDQINIFNTSAVGNNSNGIFVNASVGKINTATLDTITATNNNGYGVYYSAGAAGIIGQSIANNITVASNSANGLRFEANGVGSILTQVSATNINAANNTFTGIVAITQNSGVVNNVDFSNMLATGNTYGVSVSSNTNGSIGNANVSNVTANNNSQIGVALQALNSASLASANVQNIIANSNIQNGLFIQNNTGSTMGTITVSGVVANNNTLNGFYVQNNSANIGTVTASNITTTGNKNYGIVSVNTTGTIGTFTLSGATANGNAANGIQIQAAANATYNNVNISNASATGNTFTGIRVEGTTGALFSQVTISNSTATANKLHGVAVLTGAGAIGTVNISNVTSNNNLSYGTLVTANGGTVNQANLTGISSASNALAGIYVESNSGGNFKAATVTDSSANNNTQYGIYLNATSTSILNNVSLSSNNATGNSIYGVYVNDDTTGTFLADLGGGTLGSVGLNRIYGNTTSDIRVDVDGGTLKAQNNWWGVNTGLAGGRVSYEDASAIDSTAFLTTDPRP